MVNPNQMETTMKKIARTADRNKYLPAPEASIAETEDLLEAIVSELGKASAAFAYQYHVANDAAGLGVDPTSLRFTEAIGHAMHCVEVIQDNLGCLRTKLGLPADNETVTQ